MTNPFHGRLDRPAPDKFTSDGYKARVATEPPTYRVLGHQHPYAEQLLEVAHRGSIQGLLEADTEAGSAYTAAEFYADALGPSGAVQDPWPKANLEMLAGFDAYGIYNWELFFHVPLTVGIHLSKSQRYAEAQRWFHFIFDPTNNTAGIDSKRFWNFLPFRTGEVHRIEELMAALSGLGGDPSLKQLMERSVELWMAKPFRPHVVAQMRPSAYQWKTLLAYLDNLIAWGDSLFRRDTGESIDEAATLYILAANILGEKPKKVPSRGAKLPQTYASLRSRLDAFGNALTELETAFVFDTGPEPSDPASPGRLESLVTLGSMYFCIPGNERLQHYWSTVADRLFKIRNSLNIKGVFRRLALFEPPIDPALLARGVASGLDISSVLSGLDMPLPLVRYQLLHQRAVEAAQELRSLGATLLSYMEREDAEALQLLRARHERQLLKMSEVTRYAQWQEAKKVREGSDLALTNAFDGFAYAAQQLGKTPSEIDQLRPVMDALDPGQLQRLNLQTQEPGYPSEAVKLEMAKSLAESEGFAVTRRERDELDKLSEAQSLTEGAAAISLYLKLFGELPMFTANIQPFGSGVSLATDLKTIYESIISVMEFSSLVARNKSDRSSRMAALERRSADWTQRTNQALLEVSQATKQLRAAQIREAVAEHEWTTSKRQSKQSAEIEAFLNEEGTVVEGKATGKHLYAWLKSECMSLHSRAYDLAYEYAKKAERALQHELGDKTITAVSSQSLRGKEAFTAGDALLASLRELEAKYLDENRREFEMIRHVSLLQLDPLALIQLRHTGTCGFSIPEALFDIDAPGHYFRRIKSVTLSVPCVIGPYVGLNCELTLEQSWIRKSPDIETSPYKRNESGDDRFDVFLGATNQIVVSGAQADSGLFETNLRDERYLPFEGSGVIGTWKLALPSLEDAVPRQFDYGTISDVIMHIRYTSRADGKLRTAAVGELQSNARGMKLIAPARCLSLRYEFPTQWVQLTQSGGAMSTEIVLKREHFPYWWDASTELEIKHVVAPKAMTATIGGSAVFDKESELKLGAKMSVRTTAGESPAVELDSSLMIALNQTSASSDFDVLLIVSPK